MDYVFVRDEEEYVCKKLASEVTSQETVISEEEYMRATGLLTYQKEYGHGGARKNAGRKRKFGSPLQFQIRVTEEEKEFITYARKHHLDYSRLMESQP